MTDEPSEPDALPLGEVAPVPGEPPATPEEVVAERPDEATLERSPRGPLALAGTYLTGLGMGAADVVPGFSGGTVALVVGIYERLVANVRQGARSLSLLLRGRPTAALRAVTAVEWPFVLSLLAGILTAIVVLASTLRTLIDEQPVLSKATLVGLVLGAAMIATREFRSTSPAHPIIVVVTTIVTFLALGLRPPVVGEPGLLFLFAAGAIAICAMILPGVSGSFLLVLLGTWTFMLEAVADRRLLVLLVFGLGCGVGLAAFSTLLNWLLRRFHDLVLAALIGLMIGSVRVLWPWPADAPIGSPDIGTPEGAEAFLALAVALAAFGLVWMFGLAATAATRRIATWQARRDVASESPDAGPSERP